ncbi:hypothetical protein MAPG_09636 [Magnaporthiopsis poae ATCC 64411]|uniref:Uncharacterized protein n=1 Tax=Magnaporthiopsis poae (strain ATCC 64411 / 73-15) TaxID=644358 RepID=A0A0C4EAG6_MAGP6|nr:hypothetical protein MAPG_09636 [Magnaporthiopsis poae ATCC 64411]
MKPEEHRKTTGSATKEGSVDALQGERNSDVKEKGSQNLAMLQWWLEETPKEEPFHGLDLGQVGQAVPGTMVNVILAPAAFRPYVVMLFPRLLLHWTVSSGVHHAGAFHLLRATAARRRFLAHHKARRRQGTIRLHVGVKVQTQREAKDLLSGSKGSSRKAILVRFFLIRFATGTRSTT